MTKPDILLQAAYRSGKTSNSDGGGRDSRANLPEIVRAGIHFHTWCALSSILQVSCLADGTKWETAAKSARAELERLLDEVEADAVQTGIPLKRPPPYREDADA